MARGDAETRNKRKTKFRENKKHPYHKGGGRRSMNISLGSDNGDSESGGKKKGKR